MFNVPLSRLAGPKGKGSFKKGEWQEQHQQAFEAAKAASVESTRRYAAAA